MGFFDKSTDYSTAFQDLPVKRHVNRTPGLPKGQVEVKAQGGNCGNTLQAASLRGYKEVFQMLLD